MSAPTPVTRAVMLERDDHRCVVCGVMQQLEAQHRRRVGMGGSSFRPKVADLVTACSTHNEEFEHVLQGEALRYGWKVRSWVSAPEAVPVFFMREQQWYRLTVDGRREPITGTVAVRMMREVYGDKYDVVKGLAA